MQQSLSELVKEGSYIVKRRRYTTYKRMGNFGFDRNRECTMMGFNCKMSEYAAIGIATIKSGIKN